MIVHAYAAKSAKSPLEPFEYELGPIGPHDADVRVTNCGVCHSDIAMIDNDFGIAQFPLVPGHEVIGIVHNIGSEVTGLKVGQRVGVGWYCGSCGTCEWCDRGRQSLCAQGQPTIAGRHGGFADYVRVNWKFAVPIPDLLPSTFAGPLMCAGSSVYTPMVQHGLRPGMRTAVIGVGGLGHLAVQFLAKSGCEVTAISSSHAKDDEARRFGASHVIASKEPGELQQAANSFDFIISTVSANVNWIDYINALRPKGRLVIVGIPESEIHFPVFPLLGEKSVSGGSCGSPSDTAEMLRFAAIHNVQAMIETFPLKDVNQAIERGRSGKVRYRAVLEM